MCDTIVALGSATKDGCTLFGKNSDQEPDQAQNVKIYPRRQYKPGEVAKCAYLTIPQVAETARVMLCQPFCYPGAEMGANEYGVVMGNETLFTREDPEPTGLTDQDLLRLALERSKTARQAMETIIELLERYGQGGHAGYRQELYYMAGFVIADPQEAYVLQTVKSWWVWKQVKDFWAMSNILLEADFDTCSPGLIENAVKKGYCQSKADFNFRKCYSEETMTSDLAGQQREARAWELLSQKKGNLTTADFMDILRDHGSHPNTPDKSEVTICMHAADPLIRTIETVCALVGKIEKDRQFYYTTGAANTCMSPFYPIFFPGTSSPAGYTEGAADYDAASFWWESEKLHREALWHFNDALNAIQPQIKQYEENIISAVESSQVTLNQGTIDKYFAQARTLVEKWDAMLDSLPSTELREDYRCYWENYNKLNGIV